MYTGLRRHKSVDSIRGEFIAVTVSPESELTVTAINSPLIESPETLQPTTELSF